MAEMERENILAERHQRISNLKDKYEMIKTQQKTSGRGGLSADMALTDIQRRKLNKQRDRVSEEESSEEEDSSQDDDDKMAPPAKRKKLELSVNLLNQIRLSRT